MGQQMHFQHINFSKSMELCVQFRRDSFQSSFPGTDEWKRHWDEGEYRRWIIEHAAKFPDGVLHAVDGEEIIGQLEFAYPEDVGHVNLFYLKPDMRGVGHGAALQEHAASILRAKGCSAATLRVSPTNERAVRFYTRHGWVGLGPDPKYPQVHVYRIQL